MFLMVCLFWLLCLFVFKKTKKQPNNLDVLYIRCLWEWCDPFVLKLKFVYTLHLSFYSVVIFFPSFLYLLITFSHFIVHLA